MRFSILLGGILLAVMVSTAGATPFVNLDFEQANIQTVFGNPLYPSTYAGEAFPGWLVNGSNSPSAVVQYDNIGIGGELIAFYDQPDHTVGFPSLQGSNYAALVSDVGGPNPSSSSLSQTGDIPAGTESLTVLCAGGRPPPDLTVNDNAIPFVLLSGNNYGGSVVKYGADVSAYAGQTAQIAFIAKYPDSTITVFDNVTFSASPIPEPSTVVPFLALGVLIGRGVRRRLS